MYYNVPKDFLKNMKQRNIANEVFL